MADRQYTPQEMQRMVAELNKLERDLGRKMTSITSDIAQDAERLQIALEDARRAFSDMEGSATNAYDQIREMAKEFTRNQRSVESTTTAFRNLTRDAQSLSLLEKGMLDMSSTKLKNLKERLIKSRQIVENNQEDLKKSIEAQRIEKAVRKTTADKIRDLREEIKIAEEYGDIEGRAEAKRQLNIVRSKDARKALAFEEIKNSKALTDQQKEVLMAYYDGNAAIQQAIDATDRRIKQEAEIESKVLGFSKALAGIKSTPLLKAFSGPFEQGLAAAKAAAKLTDDQQQINAAGFAAIKDGFKSATILLIPLQKAFDFLKQAVFAVSAQTTELGKDLGTSAQEAQRLRSAFASIANDSSDLAITTKTLLEARKQLAAIAGVEQGFTETELKTQVRLTERFGLQADLAAKIVRLSRLRGENGEDILDSIISQTNQLQKQEGTTFRVKGIMREVAEIEGQLAANYANDPKLIGQAVIQVRKLGMGLKEARDASKQLLSFEDSIGAELEAELLTGRTINLERARALALQGKSAEAAQELARNFMSVEEFASLNVIAQESFAKSVGMTADELANVLVQERNISQLSKATKDALEDKVKLLKGEGKVADANRLIAQAGNEEQLKASMMRLDAEKKFQMALDKVKDVLVNIVEIMPVLIGLLSVAAGVMAAIAASAAATALGVTISTGGLAAIGAVAAIGTAGLGAYLTSPSSGEDNSTIAQPQVALAKGGIVTKPTTALVGEAGPEAVMPLDRMYAKFDELVSEVRGLRDDVRKGGDVYMDSTKVGRSLVIGSRKI